MTEPIESVELTAREREVLAALVRDGIDVQEALADHMLQARHTNVSDCSMPTEMDQVQHFINVILETHEPKMIMEGLLKKLGGENDTGG